MAKKQKKVQTKSKVKRQVKAKKKKPKKAKKSSGKSLPKVSFWKTNWLPILTIMILATLPYWQSLSYEYVLDDKMVFTENQYVQKGFAGIADIFSKESFAGYFGGQMNLLVGARYRPLSIATFAIEYGLWGQNNSASHAINILLYALLAGKSFAIITLFPSR